MPLHAAYLRAADLGAREGYTHRAAVKVPPVPAATLEAAQAPEEVPDGSASAAVAVTNNHGPPGDVRPAVAVVFVHLSVAGPGVAASVAARPPQTVADAGHDAPAEKEGHRQTDGGEDPILRIHLPPLAGEGRRRGQGPSLMGNGRGVGGGG